MRLLKILILAALIITIALMMMGVAHSATAIDPLESLFLAVEPGMSKILVLREVNSRMEKLSEVHDFSFLVNLFWRSENKEGDVDLEGNLPESRMMLIFHDNKLQCAWYGFSYNNDFKERRVKGTAPECDALR